MRSVANVWLAELLSDGNGEHHPGTSIAAMPAQSYGEPAPGVCTGKTPAGPGRHAELSMTIRSLPLEDQLLLRLMQEDGLTLGGIAELGWPPKWQPRGPNR